MSVLLFWASAAVVFLAYAAYPGVVLLAARRARGLGGGRRDDGSVLRWPRVDVVLCVQNGGRRAADKVRAILRDDYPAGLLRVVVADDGSSDETPAILAGIKDPRVRVLRREGVRGKAASLNEAVEAGDAPILVFMDQRQAVRRGSVQALVRRLRDPEVGAVSGRLVLREGGEGDADPDRIDDGDTGLGIYWRYELALRRAEGALGILTGVTGCLYAVRRALWKPLPADALIDDVSVALHARAAGFRVCFEDGAVAVDGIAEPDAELARKVRTLAGNIQVLFAPGRYGRWTAPGVWPVFICHKAMRILAAWAFLGMLAGSGLAGGQAYTLLFLLQASFWTAGLWGLATVHGAPRIFRAAAGLLLLNAAAVTATIRYFGGSSAELWRTVPERGHKRAA